MRAWIWDPVKRLHGKKTKESSVVFSGTIRINKIKMPNRKYKAIKSTKCGKSI